MAVSYEYDRRRKAGGTSDQSPHTVAAPALPPALLWVLPDAPEEAATAAAVVVMVAVKLVRSRTPPRASSCQ